MGSAPHGRVQNQTFDGAPNAAVQRLLPDTDEALRIDPGGEAARAEGEVGLDRRERAARGAEARLALRIGIRGRDLVRCVPAGNAL